MVLLKKIRAGNDNKISPINPADFLDLEVVHHRETKSVVHVYLFIYLFNSIYTRIKHQDLK